jgi:hypothetical protein
MCSVAFISLQERDLIGLSRIESPVRGFLLNRPIKSPTFDSRHLPLSVTVLMAKSILLTKIEFFEGRGLNEKVRGEP